MRISEPSFTDSGIDATGKTENQTCTRVDVSASSHRPFPCLCHGNENLWDGMGGGILTTTGFPPLCAMCHVPAEGEFPNFARGSFYDPRAGGCRTPNPEP